MTLQEAYATIWEKVFEATTVSIDVDTPARRNGQTEVEYSLHVWLNGLASNEHYHACNMPSLEAGIIELLRKVNGDEPQAADLDAIQEQVSALQI